MCFMRESSNPANVILKHREREVGRDDMESKEEAKVQSTSILFFTISKKERSPVCWDIEGSQTRY